MSKAWSVLGKLAGQRVLACRKGLQQIEALIERLDQRLGQVRGMIDENRRLQSEKQASAQSIAEVKNLADFLQRLLQIEQQAMNERQSLEQRWGEAQARLEHALREEHKMIALDERTQAQAAQLRERREQSELDASALAKFNRSRQAVRS